MVSFADDSGTSTRLEPFSPASGVVASRDGAARVTHSILKWKYLTTEFEVWRSLSGPEIRSMPEFE